MTRRIANIPARSGSSRITDKNIVEFCGRPLLTYVLAAARDSNLFDTIHVSTDSQRYADVAASVGHPVDFLRTSEMSANSVSITAVLRCVLGEYAARGENFDEGIASDRHDDGLLQANTGVAAEPVMKMQSTARE